MKKFLLRVKGEAVEFASILPVVQAIINENEDNQVAIVYNDSLELEDFWLPSRCWAYPISKKETESMFAAHKFAANLHDIFNTDYYIDYISDMYSAFLGLAFRANVKIGLQGGPKSFFYQISLPGFTGEFLDEKKTSVLSAIEGSFNKPQIDNSFAHKNVKNIFIPFPHKLDNLFIDRVNFIAECLPTIKLYGYVSRACVNLYDQVNIHKNIHLFSESTSTLARRIDEFSCVITENYAIAQMARNRGQLSFLICEEEESFPKWKYMPESIGQLVFSGNSLLAYGINELISLKTFPDLEDYISNYQSLRLVP